MNGRAPLLLAGSGEVRKTLRYEGLLGRVFLGSPELERDSVQLGDF